MWGWIYSWCPHPTTLSLYVIAFYYGFSLGSDLCVGAFHCIFFYFTKDRTFQIQFSLKALMEGISSIFCILFNMCVDTQLLFLRIACLLLLCYMPFCNMLFRYYYLIIFLAFHSVLFFCCWSIWISLYYFIMALIHLEIRNLFSHSLQINTLIVWDFVRSSYSYV